MWKTLKSKFESTDSLVSLALGLAVVLVVGMTIVNYVKTKTQVATETKKAQEESKAAEQPTKHIVKEGETLWSISESTYKSGYNWVDVAKANNLTDTSVIEVGQELVIPAVTPIVVETAKVPETKSYTVVAGDDLWDISVKQYGNGYRWGDIAKANNLTNPDIIHAGNVLVLP